MSPTEQQNKAFVLEAFETLFNKRDYVTAERYWSPSYIQHSAHIPPGREGLFELVKAAPDTLRYEHGLIIANGDYVLIHGRFSGIGQPANWIVVDIVRLEDGQLAEHWDVIQDEHPGARRRAAYRCLARRFPPDDLPRTSMKTRITELFGNKASDHPGRHASRRLCRDGRRSVECRWARRHHRSDATEARRSGARDRPLSWND
jgi:predicted SnoaL-like aldol condensation-catalyzing enzyme